MMIEYEETMQRLAANGIRATVQFFGSARALDREQYEAKEHAQKEILRVSSSTSPEALAATAALNKLQDLRWMIDYIEKTRELARRLTEWSMKSRLSMNATLNGVSRSKSAHKLYKLDAEDDQHGSPFKYPPHATDARVANANVRGGLFVCTGGAGGFSA